MILDVLPVPTPPGTAPRRQAPFYYVADAPEELDVATAAAWGDRLRKAVALAGREVEPSSSARLPARPVVVVDLRAVRLLSATALGELAVVAGVATDRGVELRLLAVAHGPVRRALSVVGPAGCFTVHARLADAVAFAGGRG